MFNNLLFWRRRAPRIHMEDMEINPINRVEILAEETRAAAQAEAETRAAAEAERLRVNAALRERDIRLARVAADAMAPFKKGATKGAKVAPISFH